MRGSSAARGWWVRRRPSRLVPVLLAGAAACAGNPAPSGWLAPAREAREDPYGAWVVLSREPAPQVAGELLAVERDSIYVLTPAGEVVAVSPFGVRRATVAFYDAQWGGLAAWTILGALSTASNGYFLVLTFPLWTVGGSLITGGQSRAPLRTLRRGDAWEAVRRYARFPQGLPPGLPRRLPPKPPRWHPERPPGVSGSA